MINLKNFNSEVESFCPEKLDVLVQLGKDINEDVLGQLLDLHISVADGIISTLQGHFQKKEFQAIARAAHQYKSNCGQLGLLKLHSYCSDLENLIHGNSFSENQIKQHLQALEIENQIALDNLRNYRRSA